MIQLFFIVLINFFLCGLASASHSETSQQFMAKPWQMLFQPAASPVMEGIHGMHHLLLVIVALIALTIAGLLSYVIFRFRAKRNPVPSTTSHNVLLEIVWTILPIIILVIIGIPSVKLMFRLDTPQEADLTVKAIGRQWYWTYEYPHQDPDKGFSYDSYMIDPKDLKPGQPRLLEVDRRLVVPVDTIVRILVTSSDVLHSFAVPALGIKRDCVPGRINETWFRVSQPGVYYGQCSELCGINHGFMPIAIHVVAKDQYEEWFKNKGKAME
jgi:cytochrome c oxidase subunit 2